MTTQRIVRAEVEKYHVIGAPDGTPAEANQFGYRLQVSRIGSYEEAEAEAIAAAKLLEHAVLTP